MSSIPVPRASASRMRGFWMDTPSSRNHCSSPRRCSFLLQIPHASATSAQTFSPLDSSLRNSGATPGRSTPYPISSEVSTHLRCSPRSPRISPKPAHGADRPGGETSSLRRVSRAAMPAHLPSSLRKAPDNWSTNLPPRACPTSPLRGSQSWSSIHIVNFRENLAGRPLTYTKGKSILSPVFTTERSAVW